ncbi:MAG: hypothetical protein CM1200mP35_06440 [Chloroflexota bacterium]|nr:MAG: hypothetical protein CM1200mP35_06440 [Chloroflexota bacterium]
MDQGCSDTPEEPEYLEIHFDHGLPTLINGETMDGVALVAHLNTLAGIHGVGRIDHLENRLVGIKSREIYEAPAATILHTAHNALENLTLTKEQARTKGSSGSGIRRHGIQRVMVQPSPHRPRFICSEHTEIRNGGR